MTWFLGISAYLAVGCMLAIATAFSQKQDGRRSSGDIVDNMVIVVFFWPIITIAVIIGGIVIIPLCGITWLFEKIVKALPILGDKK